MGADNWVQRLNILARVLRCTPIVPNSVTCTRVVLVEVVTVVEGIETLEELPVSGGETVVGIVSRCPKSIASDTSCVGVDF